MIFAVQLDVHCTLRSLHNVIVSSMFLSIDSILLLMNVKPSMDFDLNTHAPTNLIGLSFYPNGYSLNNVNCYVLSSCYSKKYKQPLPYFLASTLMLNHKCLQLSF